MELESGMRRQGKGRVREGGCHRDDRHLIQIGPAGDACDPVRVGRVVGYLYKEINAGSYLQHDRDVSRGPDFEQSRFDGVTLCAE